MKQRNSVGYPKARINVMPRLKSRICKGTVAGWKVHGNNVTKPQSDVVSMVRGETWFGVAGES